MSSEMALLPCPFCGGEAKLFSSTSSTVQCQNDQCIIGDPAPFNDFSHRADAIAAWNTRQQAEARATSVVGDFLTLLRQFEAAVVKAEFRRPRGPRSGDREYHAELTKTVEELRTAVVAAASPAEAPGEGAGWRTDLDAAPRDGTAILAWCVHPNAKYADTVAADSDWQGPVVAYWTDHNAGGWVWHGLCGAFTHWMPLPAAPAQSIDCVQKSQTSGNTRLASQEQSA